MSAADRSLELARLLEGTGITLLSLTEGGETLTLRRPGGGTAAPIAVVAAGRVVAAPCAGVFLCAHPLRSGRLVEVGDTVAAGAVQGLLRIGPLLVEVRAPVAGVVVAVEAAEGVLAGFGAALFRLAEEETGA